MYYAIHYIQSRIVYQKVFFHKFLIKYIIQSLKNINITQNNSKKYIVIPKIDLSFLGKGVAYRLNLYLEKNKVKKN